MWRPSSSPRRSPKSESSARPSLSPRSTLTEVLRINQFRSKNASSPALLGVEQEVEDESVALNKDLAVLANVFPDVKVECLRELLRRFDGDSRLEICTEELYRHKAEWVKGRIEVPPRDLDDPIPTEEQFRNEQYVQACTRLLRKEFSSLNKSAVDAVLAEVNNSYPKARPILQEIVTKSWRATIQSIFSRRKARDHVPAFLWERGGAGRELAPSGSVGLDGELETLFLQPAKDEEVACQEERDRQLAIQLNVKEAKQAEALYECQICCSDAPFENISTCTSEAHVVCLDCVRRSLNEAIFGQNWAQSVDTYLGTLRCLAPTDPRCDGYIPHFQLKQAVLLEKSGPETWTKFEDRLAEKAMLEAQLPIVRCPFCSYAEAEDEITLESARRIDWSFRTIPTHYKILVILASEFLLPSLLFIAVVLRLLWPAFVPNLFYTSLARIAESHRTSRFRCLNPFCKRASCLKCLKPWHDTHICHEPLLLSLRQSVEAARTNAVKRVCPRCGTAFVKSSGCNKLTCVCGYSMCYLCRKNIGKTGNNDGAEGYRHFCEHFRPVPGQKCTQCDKCDLYKNEEEDVLVKRAGEDAEREWREKQGQNKKDVDGIRIDHDGIVGQAGIWDRFVRGDWTVQGMSDWVVGQAVVVKI